MKALKNTCFILFAIAVRSLATQAANFAVIEREIHLKPEAEVWSQTVCLSDFVQEAWVQGRCAIDRENCCRWSLEDQRTRVFSASELEKELRKIVFPGYRLVLRDPAPVTVVQTRRQLNAKEIGVKLKTALLSRLGIESDKLVIKSIRPMSPAYVDLAHESDWNVVVVDPIQDRLTLKIISTLDPLRILGTFEAAIRVDADVYVAKRDVAPGSALLVDDFQVKRAAVFGAEVGTIAPGGLFRVGEFPVGSRARQSILSGKALVASAIERVPLVKLGDTVTLLLRSDSLRVSTKAVVQGNAAAGDMVTVQLPHYNRTFRGRLTEEKLVEVWL